MCRVTDLSKVEDCELCLAAYSLGFRDCLEQNFQLPDIQQQNYRKGWACCLRTVPHLFPLTLVTSAQPKA